MRFSASKGFACITLRGCLLPNVVMVPHSIYVGLYIFSFFLSSYIVFFIHHHILDSSKMSDSEDSRILLNSTEAEDDSGSEGLADDSGSKADESGSEADDSGSEADDSESLESSAVHRRQLLDSIKNLEEAGSFAASRTHHSFPNPGIRVDGEIIALPLSDEAARNLASRSLNAPVGFAGTDEAVSKTLEIGMGRIAFMNPIWSDFIEDVVSHVAQELGVPSPADGHQVRAKFSRHLLHPPGATLEAPK